MSMGYYVLDEIEKGDYKFSLDTFLGDPAANICCWVYYKGKGYSFQSEKGGKWSVIVKSGDRKLVLKEYGHMTLLEVAEWVKTAKQLNKEDIDKMFEKNTEKSNVKNDDCKIGGHVVPDDMAKNFGAVEVDGAVDVPDHTWDEEAEMKKDTDRFHVLA